MNRRKAHHVHFIRARHAMSPPDLNLLPTLDALLTEGSVAGAARRLGLSPSAMSRALARLRAATGDPLLVRAGRGLVATPRALELRERIGSLVQEAEAMLRPARRLRLKQLQRRFTLRSREGFVENFGARLLERVAAEAPGVQLHFLPKLDKDAAPLRDGRVDLETGVLAADSGPELRTQALFRDRLVCVMRPGHALGRGPLTAAKLASTRQVGVALQGSGPEALDTALAAQGLQRPLAATVGGFAAALALVREADLVACVPERHTGSLRAGLRSLPLPPELGGAPITISLLWHPRWDGDAAHRWLRGCVQEVCGDPA